MDISFGNLERLGDNILLTYSQVPNCRGMLNKSGGGSTFSAMIIEWGGHNKLKSLDFCKIFVKWGWGWGGWVAVVRRVGG